MALKKPPRRVTSFSEALLAFGGLRGLIRVTGANDTSVHNWIAREQFPTHYYKLMSDWLRRRGYRAAPELWGQQERRSAA